MDETPDIAEKGMTHFAIIGSFAGWYARGTSRHDEIKNVVRRARHEGCLPPEDGTIQGSVSYIPDESLSWDHAGFWIEGADEVLSWADAKTRAFQVNFKKPEEYTELEWTSRGWVLPT